MNPNIESADTRPERHTKENTVASSAPTFRSQAGLGSPAGFDSATPGPSARTLARKARAARSLLPRPKAGEVRVRVGALGMTPHGLQAAGLVEAVGPEAGGFAPGDRVSYRATAENSGLRPTVSERDLIGFPKDIALDQAASLLPYGLIARTIVKQLHAVGRGNRVFVTPDEAGVDDFVKAWIADLGGRTVDTVEAADVVVAASDYSAARRWRYGQGLSQQAAVDVFQAVRRGVFDHFEITSYPLAEAERARTELTSTPDAGPIVLLPAA